MAFALNIPFLTVKLHLSSGGTVLNPLLDLPRLSINEKTAQIAGHFRHLFQSNQLNKGAYTDLLHYYQQGDYYQSEVSLGIAASKDGVSFPQFQLDFEYFFQLRKGGAWVVVPALGLETFTADPDYLDEHLRDVIYLDFVRRRRLSDLKKIVAVLWYQKVELIAHEIDLVFPGLKELDKLAEETQEQLLPKVARPLVIQQQVAFGRKAELDQLVRMVKGKFNRNVILVGPSGVGKTVLVWELVRQKRKRRISGKFWETTASILIKELSDDTGWENNLASLCQELSRSGDLLFIRNFLELFEVGKYVGNEVSMAEFIRSYVSRGEINLITECTEEELARIQLHHPNYISYFQILTLTEPKDELETIIIEKVESIAKARSIQIMPEAIRETIRLNRRFTPYAGFPGKPIRFLESLLINAPKQLGILDQAAVIKSFCEETGMPQFMIDPVIPMRLSEVQQHFSENIFGQPQAIHEVSSLLASVKTALTRTGKPIASLLFVGPTGVGKTEMAKVLAGFMFGNRDRMLRFDMSEFADPYSVMRLTGESYFSDGVLTSAVRRDPFSVLLFDEIEKAHPDFYDLLLQILSEGRLTDSSGKLVNFCSTIIIMTSNIGADNLQQHRIGWSKVQDTEAINAHFMSAVQKHFRPELYNRIDQVIPFEPLQAATMRHVVEREIKEFRRREGVNFRKLDILIADPVLDFLARAGYESKYGARQLQRTIRELLVLPLARVLNHYEYDDQLIVRVELVGEEIQLDVEADPLAIELLLEELDKINYADHASELRRQVFRLRESHSFVRMLSQLDLLERRKRQLGERFWKEGQQATQYTYYLELKDELEELLGVVEDYEMNLSLACMGMQVYKVDLTEQLKEWEKTFFAYKVKLYSRLYPEASHCQLVIYGKVADPILDFYMQLFERFELNVTAESIWFNENLYSQTEQHPADEQGNLLPRYHLQSWPLGAEFVPPEKGDILCGVAFKLQGPGVALRFEDEAGLQRWKQNEGPAQVFMLAVGGVDYIHPDNIHRREFYKATVRRVFSPGHFKDTRLKINREINSPQIINLLEEQLRQQFKIHIQQALG